MAQRNNTKTGRKVLGPIFHLQTKTENDEQLSKALLKTTRQTGKLNLSGRSLNMVPEKLWKLYEPDKEETSLSYDLNSSDYLDKQPWWNYHPLTNLDLSSNCLTEIPGQIKIFQELQTLNLHDNLLTKLPVELQELTKLTKLNLSHNKLSVIPECVTKLTELVNLSVSYNNIEEVTESLTDLVMLQELDLSHNQILVLPPGLGYLVRLTQANLSYNKLVELPPDLVNMRGTKPVAPKSIGSRAVGAGLSQGCVSVLIKLDVTHNELTALPPLGELRKLQLLYATHNNIVAIPDCEGCESLQEMYLGNNYIKEISPEFCEAMPHLKVLDLRDNKVEQLPDEVSKMQQLTRLDVSNNTLTNLPNSLGQLKRLQSLRVEGNMIRTIRRDIIQCGTSRILKFLIERGIAEQTLAGENSGDGAIKTMVAMEVFPDKYAMKQSRMVNLTLKQLSVVPDEVFQNAKEAQITHIDLGRNKFQQVPPGLSALAESLTELNMGVNLLTDLPDFLSQFSKLQYLNLSSNALTSLPESFSELKHLREIIISNNKFTDIPSCLYEIEHLEIFLASDNRITSIDATNLAKLKYLATLDLSNNNIDYLPPELGNMTQLRSLQITGNSFRQPRYAVLVKGTISILSYLRDRIPT